jgi:hypothetical protein
MWNRKQRNGYSNFGAIAIPALPQPIILTDRGDGTLWLLSWTTTPSAVDGNGYIMINSDYGTISRRDGVTTYAAYEEPVFGQNGEYRLLIRDGYLGFEIDDFPVGQIDQENMPIFARRQASRDLRQLYLSTTTYKHIRTPAWTPDITSEIL